MKRIEAIFLAVQVAAAQDALIVCNIGFPSRELSRLRIGQRIFTCLAQWALPPPLV